MELLQQFGQKEEYEHLEKMKKQMLSDLLKDMDKNEGQITIRNKNLSKYRLGQLNNQGKSIDPYQAQFIKDVLGRYQYENVLISYLSKCKIDKVLLSNPDSIKRRAIHLAAMNGDIVALKYIIQHDVDVNDPDQYGFLPLELCLLHMRDLKEDDENSRYKQFSRCVDLLYAYIDEKLVQHKNDEYSLFQLALQCKRYDVVFDLLQRGCGQQVTKFQNLEIIELLKLYDPSTMSIFHRLLDGLIKNGWTLDSSLGDKVVLKMLSIPELSQLVMQSISIQHISQLKDDKGFGALFYSVFGTFSCFEQLLNSEYYNPSETIGDQDVLLLCCKLGKTRHIKSLLKKPVELNGKHVKIINDLGIANARRMIDQRLEIPQPENYENIVFFSQ